MQLKLLNYRWLLYSYVDLSISIVSIRSAIIYQLPRDHLHFTVFNLYEDTWHQIVAGVVGGFTADGGFRREYSWKLAGLWNKRIKEGRNRLPMLSHLAFPWDSPKIPFLVRLIFGPEQFILSMGFWRERLVTLEMSISREVYLIRGILGPKATTRLKWVKWVKWLHSHIVAIQAYIEAEWLEYGWLIKGLVT